MPSWKELQIAKLEKLYAKFDAELLSLKSSIERGPNGLLSEKEFLRVVQAWDKIQAKHSRLENDISKLKREVQGIPSDEELLRIVNAWRRQNRKKGDSVSKGDVK